MQTTLEKLRDILIQEEEIHDQLIATANEMNDTLKSNMADSIKKCATRYDELIFRIEQCEEARLCLCDQLAKEIVPSKRHINLNDIIAHLDQSQQAEFTGLQKRLKEKMKTLSAINTSNQIWLEESLNNMARTVSLLTRAKSYVSGYKNKGEKAENVIDTSIINKRA